MEIKPKRESSYFCSFFFFKKKEKEKKSAPKIINYNQHSRKQPIKSVQVQ